MDDVDILIELNDRFVRACRQGTFEVLLPMFSPEFRYLDGATGEVWDKDRFMKEVADNPSSTVRTDQVVVHVDGDSAAVSARSLRLPNHSSRYLDTYERRDGQWICVHCCSWPLETRLP